MQIFQTVFRTQCACQPNSGTVLPIAACCWLCLPFLPPGVEDVKARYTFIYRKIDDKWFIAEHHSSAMPEK